MAVVVFGVWLFVIRCRTRSKRRKCSGDGKEESVISVFDEAGQGEKSWDCRTDEKSDEIHELEEAAKPAELSSVGRLAELEGG